MQEGKDALTHENNIRGKCNEFSFFSLLRTFLMNVKIIKTAITGQTSNAVVDWLLWPESYWGSSGFEPQLGNRICLPIFCFWHSSAPSG
jgi:hypothetical protein